MDFVGRQTGWQNCENTLDLIPWQGILLVELGPMSGSRLWEVAVLQEIPTFFCCKKLISTCCGMKLLSLHSNCITMNLNEPYITWFNHYVKLCFTFKTAAALNNVLST